MKTKKPLTQLKLTMSFQEKPLTDFSTPSWTSQHGGLPLNRKELCLFSEESSQPQDVKDLDMQFTMEDFEIIKVIGKGSGGVVQLIRHKFMGTLFALKSIHMNVQETVREQIGQEIKINQNSLCPHVVFCHHSFYCNGIISLVLEYMDRGSIADIIKQVRTIPEPYLAVLCQQVLKGLVYLHNERHIIHRDIKPSHLLVNHKGEVKIAGFGASAVLASSMDQSDTFVGTYNYMAPERINGSSYGLKSDIWSLGLVILECATGSFPYKQTENEEGPLNFYELLETIVEEPPPSVSEDYFSPEFCSFISACLQKDPQQRMSSLELLSHPFIKKFEDKDIDLGILFEQTIEPPGNASGVDDAVIYGREDDKKNLLLSDDCKGLDSSLIQITNETTSKMGDTVIYGREDDKKKVIKLLLSDECSELEISLIQITGTGGIGKSTLAYLVYSDSMICDYFDMKAWVHMPESIDIGRILNAIIESLTGISCYVTELNELYQIIGEELSGKRFLIVLDNLRNGTQSFWRSFMVSLSIGTKGSLIMVTTRTEIISDLMRSIRPYHLNNLSDEHCFSIFADYAFDKQEPCTFPELMRTGKHIVAKCEGIPLAAKAVGSLLHFNENNLPPDRQCWKDVLESALWESDECFPAISLCYDYLPLHMKLCFRYCFLFPEGYIFEKDHLVRLWMSQGYLESTDGEAAEDIGINCFEELLRRSFFQCLHIYDARERKYGIHDLFHKFAQRVAVECFRMEDSKLSYIPGNISHISLVPCVVEALEFPYLLKRQSDLCTFLFIPRSASKWPGSAVHIENTIVLDDLFIKSRYLRSLDLSNTDIKELPDSIESLKSLCYLGLNNTNIRRLPNSICSLGSLQTLELQDCSFLSDLPSNIKELTKLRCLNVFKEPGFISMPSGIGELRNLRTLSNFNVGKVRWHCGIGELQNLLDLRGSLCISGLENVVSGAQANQANLKMKGYLKTLTLHWFQNGWESEVETEQNALDVIQYLQPHINLEELIIRGYFGSQFPTWLGDPLFCNLVSLALDNCYESNVLPPLGQLPSLRFLSLQKMDSIRTLGFDFCGSCSEVLCRFPSLEILKLREMSELEEWNWVRDGDFPQLRCLSISMCFKLIKLPPLNHLRELVFHCCDRLPKIPRLKSLEYLKIDGFQKLEFLSLPDDLPALKKLEINNCGRLSWLVGMSQLASVEQFKVSKCPQIHLNEQWPDKNQAVSISGGYPLSSACSFEEVTSPNEVSDVSDGKHSSVTEARAGEIEDHGEPEKERRNLRTRVIEFYKGQHSHQHAPPSTESKESTNNLSGLTESSFQTISTSLPLGGHSNFIKFNDAIDRQSKRKGEFVLQTSKLRSGSSDWKDGDVAEARSIEIEDHGEPEKKRRNLQTRVIEFYKGEHSQKYPPRSTE